MKKKRLLVLGAGEAQLQIIRTAKKLNIYTIVCDNRSELEGSKIADKYYNIDYMSRKDIIEIARIEEIDGVISNSEPAMHNVAWVSSELNLPGNSEKSIELLTSKIEFRKLQESAGEYFPKSFLVDTKDKLWKAVEEIGYPFVIKPMLSSGTRGTTVVEYFDLDLIENAYFQCSRFSRNKIVVVEEYVKMNSLVAYDAEIFVHGNEILWDGMYASIRDCDAPMIPVMESLPLGLPKHKELLVKESITNLIRHAGIVLGEYNAETYFTEEEKVFVIEINPRQGGNHIPELVYEHSGIDFTALLCTSAVGDNDRFNEVKNKTRDFSYVTMYVVFSKFDGIYKGTELSDEIMPFVRWYQDNAEIGTEIHKKENAGDALAYVRMEFETIEQQKMYMNNVGKHIKPMIEV